MRASLSFYVPINTNILIRNLKPLLHLFIMRKLISLVFIAVTYVNGAFAQIIFENGTTEQNLSKEIVAGINVADISKYDSRTGFHIGIRGTYNFSNEYNGTYANAGALISLKGGQLDYGDILNVNIDAYYLEIPIHIGYKHTFNEKFALFGEFGPYFGIGIFGKIKLESEGESLTVDTFSEKGGVKRFDMGLGFRFGAEINKLIPISIGYDFGLTNINNDNNGKFKNSNLMVSIGYKF